MKQLYALFLGLIYVSSFAQEPTKNELITSIDQVKVFLNSAEITRRGSFSLKPGDYQLQVKMLSPFMDKKSIQVKGDGNFKILSVNHEYDFLNNKNRTTRTATINNKLTEIDRQLKKYTLELNVIAQKISFLNSNKTLSPDKLADVNNLESVLRFYEQELKTAQERKFTIEVAMEELKEERSAYKSELLRLQDNKDKATSTIVITLRSAGSGKGKFKISYLVKNAGWYPRYDIRATNVSEPIEIDYKASLYQNTGEDWDNVKLIFSNINADDSGEAPRLQKWRLNYDRYTIKSSFYMGSSSSNEVKGIVVSAQDGEPLPGVNVVVKGTTIGSVTDIDGAYSLTLPQGEATLVFSFIGFATQEIDVVGGGAVDVILNEDVQQLSEVVVTGYGLTGTSGSSYSGVRRTKTMVSGTQVYNQTSVDFVINEPYSLKSQGQPLLIDLKQYVVNGIFEYYAVPKLNSNAFLVAKVVDWNKMGFLEGEANLFFEDAFVGKSILDTQTAEDTLRISLGKDRSVIVRREKSEEYTKRKSLGNNKVEKTGFVLTVRNNKLQDIVLHLFDQIPVSVNNQINVNLLDNQTGELNEDDGIIKWVLNVKAGSVAKVDFLYEVKYPGYETLSLE